MERYFYHGVGKEINRDTLDVMLTIIDTGIIKSRSAVGYSGDEYEHVCLYRKNDDYNYVGNENMITAYDGWINHAFCFIISPNVVAEKTNCYHSLEDESDAGFTDLLDEWRSDGDISLDKVVGIGLPLDEIEELRDTADSVIDEEFDDKLSEILMFAESMGWRIVNSNSANFADRLDDELDALRSNKYI